MSNLMNEINEVLLRAPENRHSYFQLKYFVLGKEPTTQSQMWQALRELQSRKDTIDSINLQLEDLKDDLELIEISREMELDADERCDDKLKCAERVIKVRKLKRKKESITSNINNLEKKLLVLTQEAGYFLKAFKSLEEIEELKDYDDYDAQAEFWERKISEEINLRILTQQPLPVDLIKTGLSLPPESNTKRSLEKLLKSTQNCLLSKKDLNEKSDK